MTMLKSSLCCFLCQGTISVRSENLDKFKFHLENVHDVFYDHDILVAVNFLEAHEKEVILEKVLPRIKEQFENVHTVDGKYINGGKLGIEKRLLELDGNSENENVAKRYKIDKDSSAPFSDIADEKLRIEAKSDHDRIAENNFDDESDIEDDAVSVGEALDKSNDKPEDEFTTCYICNQSIRKTILNFHLKSHSSTAECTICKQVLQKRSLPKHMRRCEIMNSLRRERPAAVQEEVSMEEEMVAVDEHEQQESKFTKIDKTTAMKSSESNCPVCGKLMLKGNINRHIRLVHGKAKEDFKCKICFASFHQLDSLEIHTYKEHNLDLEDMEQMLQEKTEDENSSKLGNETLEGITNLEPVDETKKFKCEQCDNVYTSKDSVRRHRRKAHE